MTIVEVDLDAFKEAAKSAYEKLGWTDLREGAEPRFAADDDVEQVDVLGLAHIVADLEDLARNRGGVLNLACVDLPA